MGLTTNKYHVSDDGIVYQVEDDGSIIKIGRIDALLNQPASEIKPDGKQLRTRNWAWISTLIGVLILLLIYAFSGIHFCLFDLDSSAILCFDSPWIYFLVLCCIFGTWLMQRKQVRHKIWIYLPYSAGVFFLSCEFWFVYSWIDIRVWFIDRWDGLGVLMNYISIFFPAIICALWAYAFQNCKTK